MPDRASGMFLDPRLRRLGWREERTMLRRLAIAGLRRDRSATAVLGALVLISVLLAAIGAAVIGRLAGVSESLLERADAPDVVQMHTGELDPEQIAAIDSFAAQSDDLQAHQVTDLLTLEGSGLAFEGVPQSASIQQNSLTVPTPERDRLLTLEDQTLMAVEPGTIWLPVIYMIENELEVGDTVTITAADGFHLELEIAGFLRDSLMNTAFASSKRLAVAQADFDLVAAHTGTPEHLISFWSSAPGGAVSELKAEYADSALPSSGPMLDRSAFRMLMLIGEGLVAGLMLLIAALVAAVGVICVRLAIDTTLERDRAELGVMRAIGIPHSVLLRVYLLRYALIAVPATAAGLLGAVLLEPVLSADLTLYAGGSAGAAGLLAPAVTALALLGMLLLLVTYMLRRVGRGSPAAALRDPVGPRGGTARRRRRAARTADRRPVLTRAALPASIVLAGGGLRRRAGQSLLLLGVFALCMMLVVIPSGVAGTLASPRMLSSLGVGPVDVLVQLRAEDGESAALAEEAQKALDEDPRVEALSAEAVGRHEVIDAEGGRVALPVAKGDRGELPLEYAEGRAPEAPDEIALSLLALLETGTSVGEVLTMHDGGETLALRVVGAYQDLTYGGITARMHQSMSETDSVVERYMIGVALEEGADPGAFVAEITARFPALEIAEVSVYRQQLLGPLSSQMQRTAVIATLSSLALAALMSAMVLRLQLAAERPQLMVQQDLGIPRSFLTRRVTVQMLVLLLLGAGFGAAAGAVVGQGMLNLALEAMLAGPMALFQGASRLELEIDPLVTGLALPALLTATVTLTSIMTSRAVLRTMTRRQ